MKDPLLHFASILTLSAVGTIFLLFPPMYYVLGGSDDPTYLIAAVGLVIIAAGIPYYRRVRNHIGTRFGLIVGTIIGIMSTVNGLTNNDYMFIVMLTVAVLVAIFFSQKNCVVPT